MQEFLKNLTQFIEDFNLRKPNGIVCFNAKVAFATNQTTKTIASEVHIITSDNLATIYLPSLDTDQDAALPHMFDLRISGFIYIDKQYLKIETGSYIVSIFPATKNPG